MTTYQGFPNQQYPDPQSYPDPQMPDVAQGSPDSTRPAPWRRGYMAQAKLAPWPMRLASGAIDYLPLAFVYNLLVSVHAALLGFFVTAALLIANSVYMQGTTGQSLGKRLLGIRLVSAVETGPWEFRFVYPGVGRCLGRQFAHIVDATPLYLGFLRPLWHRECRTWADSIAKTVVLDRSASEFDVHQRQPGETTTRNL